MKIAIRPFQLNSGRFSDRLVVESYRGLFSEQVTSTLEAAISAAMLITRLTLLGKTGNTVVIHVMTQALLSFLSGFNRPVDADDTDSDLPFPLRAELWSFLDVNAVGGSTEFSLSDWVYLEIEQPDEVQV